MRVCHPQDATVIRRAHNLLVIASCHAPRCNGAYARLVNSSVRLTNEMTKFYLSQNDWASFTMMQLVLDEMRCAAPAICRPCKEGGSLKACEGVPKASLAE